MKAFLRFLLPALLAVAHIQANLRATEEVAAPRYFGGGIVSRDNLDLGAFASWVAGKETVIDSSEKMNSPEWVIWTRESNPGYRDFKFGSGVEPGPRHLRIGFLTPIEIGTVLVRGGGQLSVLKSDAAYPGDLGNDADWIPAQRMSSKGQVTQNPFGGWTTWVLPPGTTTTLALRFTHAPSPIDKSFAGTIGGMLILPKRMVNLAPLARAAASSRNEQARLINNEYPDGLYTTWQNREKSADRSAPGISDAHPEWVTLTWDRPVKLSGLVAFFAGFSAAEVQAFTGPESVHPKDAPDGNWQTIDDYGNLQNGYPALFWPNWMRFPTEVTARAIRLRITAPTDERHPHLNGNTMEGRRVWLDELMALSPLDDQPLADQVTEKKSSEPIQPPIPIKFTIQEPGYVTLVIEKNDGERVRNLVSEKWFPAGENVAWWDGTDDLLRDPGAADHGLYYIPARPVKPGNYRVRGLFHSGIDPHFEFSVYTAGHPAWRTEDKTGAWLANHSAPQAAVFVPASRNPFKKPLVFLGAYISEGTDGVIWVDLDGRKQGGKGWVGGTWTAAPYMAFDAGPDAIPENHVYVASQWPAGAPSQAPELRLNALTAKDDKPVLRRSFEYKDHAEAVPRIGGLAAWNGILIVSRSTWDDLLFVDARSGKVLGSAPLEKPRGLAFDSQGRLYAISGKKIIRYDRAKNPADLPAAETLVSTGLDAPQQIALDSAGRIYVSDWGNSHQVKVYSPEPPEEADPSTQPGEYHFLRAIGHSGAPKAGPYDPLHLNHPDGLTVDEKNQLWVTENDFLPKRVSVWTLDGELIRTFYGPPKYGGGGTLDPQDKSRFYYAEENDRGAMEFKLDWEKGTSKPSKVIYRPGPDTLPLPFRARAPELALDHDGRRYFTNCFNTNPTNGHGTAVLFLEKNGVAQPVAIMGRATEWDLLRSAPFLSRWPENIDPKAKDLPKYSAYFAWSDVNADGQAQPEEVTIRAGGSGGVTIMPDLSFLFASVNGSVTRYSPQQFTAEGVPIYDLAAGQVLARNTKGTGTSGGDQALLSNDGWTVATLGIGPFAGQSVSGAKDGKAKWSYPSLWPGLHAGHNAPRPDRPGQLIATTRLLGGFIEPKISDAGPLWAINGNTGTVYLFTADGLFVSTLFADGRIGKPWAMPIAERNQSLKGVSLSDENFWPTISQTSDGNIYVVDGSRSSIVRLDGLESIRRLPDGELSITAEDLEKAQEYRELAERERRSQEGGGVLEVALLSVPPSVDGNLGDWKGKWADIDKSGVKAYFNSQNKAYDITGSLAVAGGRLYAAYRTGDPKLADNSGEMPASLFKTGGALDLMIAANPAAKPDRRDPAAGDQRLLVSVVQGKPRALLYRAVVPGTADADKVPFSSPWRTITLDRVEDVTSQLEFGAKDGNYEFSIPLRTLGIKPQSGLRLRGDLGVLRGSGGTTTARTYWSNKATGIVSDVPSEAMLTPALWGILEFKNSK